MMFFLIYIYLEETITMARDLVNEPAFEWWVPYTLRNKDNIIAEIKSRVKVNTHKYGIKVPRSMAHAKKLDETNWNTLWNQLHLKCYPKVS
jgi:hypothetical protein